MGPISPRHTWFLLDAARNVDVALKTPFHSGHHTTSNPSQDIPKMTTCLLEEKVTYDAQCKGPKFDCPQQKGSNKMGEAFVRYVQGDDDDNDNTENISDEDIVDIDYELFLTVTLVSWLAVPFLLWI